MQPATISTEAGHTWWLCPNCRKRLAEIIGERVVVRIGHETWTTSLRQEPDTVCSRCGERSSVPMAP